LGDFEEAKEKGEVPELPECTAGITPLRQKSVKKLQRLEEGA